MTAVTRTAPKAPVQGFTFPTHDQLVKTYGSIVDSREKSHSLTALKHAPANAEKFPKYNISKGLGVGRTVYLIRGELYLKKQVIAPNAKPQWFKAGPAPLF
jgi:hypothetical protein